MHRIVQPFRYRKYYGSRVKDGEAGMHPINYLGKQHIEDSAIFGNHMANVAKRAFTQYNAAQQIRHICHVNSCSKLRLKPHTCTMKFTRSRGLIFEKQEI